MPFYISGIILSYISGKAFEKCRKTERNTTTASSSPTKHVDWSIEKQLKPTFEWKLEKNRGLALSFSTFSVNCPRNFPLLKAWVQPQRPA